MNNDKNNNSSDNIDDILDILQKRREQDMAANSATKTNHDVVKRNESAAFSISSEEAKEKPALPDKKTTDNDTVSALKDDKEKTEGNVGNGATKQIPISVPSPASREERHIDKEKTASSNHFSHKTHVSPDAGVSLSDFDAREAERENRADNKKKRVRRSGVPGVIKISVYLVIVIAVSVAVSVATIKIGNDVFAFVKSDDTVVVNIPENATLKDVAEILEEANVIKYPFVFEKYAENKIKKRSYLTEDFIAGEHSLSPMMNYDKIISSLCVSAYDKSVVRITIPEGYSFTEIMDLFVKEGVMKESDKEDYIKQLQEFPYEYSFMTTLENDGSLENKDRYYRLEGYLFPDTYDFYKNENPTAAIDKLLANFENKFSDEMYERADELGMTLDQVITLASMIEAEGDSPTNFAKISSVFHNRMNDTSGSFKYLGSDATTLYALKISGSDKKTLEKGDTDFVHSYNTYTSIGLPPGPICNPGTEAIYAALYPDKTNYYYFLTMANGETVFARTAAEHNENIAKSNRIAQSMKEEAE